MLLLSSLLMVLAVPSTRSARVTVLAHPLHSKVSLCSLAQSSSCPRRITCSPHPLHSSTIWPEAAIARSNTFIPSFFPLLLLWCWGGRRGGLETHPSIRNIYNLSYLPHNGRSARWHIFTQRGGLYPPSYLEKRGTSGFRL